MAASVCQQGCHCVAIASTRASSFAWPVSDRLLCRGRVSVPQSVIISLAIFGTVSNLAMLDAARALGDNFPVVSTLVVTSLVTMVSALFGCPFPTSVYIGASGLLAALARTTGERGSSMQRPRKLSPVH